MRLRLKQGEVASLANGGVVEETTPFGSGAGGRLRYALVADEAVTRMTATYADGSIVVTVPAGDARRWATSDEVGLSADQDVGGGDPLRILVEKDFACLEPRAGEDDRDAYPNPNASCD